MLSALFVSDVVIRPSRTVSHDSAFVELKLINEAPIGVHAYFGEPDGHGLPACVCVRACVRARACLHREGEGV